METKNNNIKTEEVKTERIQRLQKTTVSTIKPTNSYVITTWLIFLTGLTSYFIGLWNSEMQLNEKGYYFTIIMFGLFAVISVQKSVRDKQEGLPVTELYYGLSWFSTLLCVALLIIGLWNADLWLSEKGFFGIAFLLALFGAITIQKNVRDNKTN